MPRGRKYDDDERGVWGGYVVEDAYTYATAYQLFATNLFPMEEIRRLPFRVIPLYLQELANDDPRP